ncbi:MAG TPA: DUF4389 domain-containing protein [Chloroflexota bacterium]|nr:DUF4389 domain-containing protein [Chloroflexota bacterium]
MQQTTYPVTLSIDYPDRPLNRLTSFFRIFVAIPILILLGTITSQSQSFQSSGASRGVSYSAVGAGILFLPPLLMILFRQKYPRWWFDWNLQFLRFGTRIGVFLALMDDTYPSTDEEQSVHLDLSYPDVPQDLNRWLPLVKWILAIPHYIVLFFLYIAAVICVIIAWFAILFTGRYPQGLFNFVEGVIRWHLRVAGYALVLVTDAYPPFSLAP